MRHAHTWGKVRWFCLSTLITDWLSKTAERLRKKPAFIEEGHSVSFEDLSDASCRIASSIIRMGIADSPVVISMESTASCAAAFLGVMMSGNFYAAIDRKTPPGRLEMILSRMSPALVVRDATDVKIPGGYRVIDYDTLLSEAPDSGLIRRARERMSPDDFAYVIFTSGSTGTPKGVVVTKGRAADHIERVSEELGVDEASVLANQVPFQYAFSQHDVFAPVVNGCTTVIPGRERFVFPGMMPPFLRENGVNTLFWVPSALSWLARSGALEKSETIPDLRKIIFCGEVMPEDVLTLLSAAFPKAKFLSLYGSTEIGCAACCEVVPGRYPLPLGRICRGIGVRVAGAGGDTASPKESGELLVTGTISSSYYRDEEATKAAFIRDTDGLWYKTGDIVRVGEDGELYYVSRADFQVKRMGYRIEMGEIEAAVTASSDVSACCCLYDAPRDDLAVFFAGMADESALRECTSDVLPVYMRPTRYVRLSDMPLTPNGKTDRVSLRKKLEEIYAAEE